MVVSGKEGMWDSYEAGRKAYRKGIGRDVGDDKEFVRFVYDSGNGFLNKSRVARINKWYSGWDSAQRENRK